MAYPPQHSFSDYIGGDDIKFLRKNAHRYTTHKRYETMAVFSANSIYTWGQRCIYLWQDLIWC